MSEMQTYTIAERFPTLRAEAKELIGNLEESQEEGEWEDEDEKVDTENAITAMRQISELSDVPESFGNLSYDFRFQRWDNALDNAKEIVEELGLIHGSFKASKDPWVIEFDQAMGYCTDL